MRKNIFLQKVLIVTTAALLVGTASPLVGEAHASTYQMTQDLFSRVGLKLPNTIAPDRSVEKKSYTPVNSENVTKPQPTSNQVAGSGQSSQQQTSVPDSGFGNRIIATGGKYMGTPYKFGAPSGQTNTFDCSSFVQHVYGQNGVKLPRNSRQQSAVGKEVSRSELQKGDLVFFKLKSSNGRIAHVGIYAGNGKLLHTYGPGGVRYDNLSAGWLEWGYVKATRVTPGN